MERIIFQAFAAEFLRAFVSASFRATGEKDFAPTPLASLQPCGAKQEPEYSGRTLLWLLVRGPESAVATAWPVQQAQPWRPGGTGGPGAAQEVALLQEGCPS